MKKIFQLEEANAIAKSLIDDYIECDVWTFEGEMGAGKTTLIQFLMKNLHQELEVSSPTFSIVNEYKIMHSKYQKVYHFDLYRLKNEEELWDIGIEEYLDDDTALKIIEWPQLAFSFIQKPYLAIQLEYEQINQRQISTELIKK